MPAKKPKDLAAQRKQARLDSLYETAARVERKYGRDENGVPSDYNEWLRLRQALKNVIDHGDVSVH